ncbi:hypothetical protein BDL97_19G033100 [Sphagnum fallax]|jgi:hypothetical protein|nr:hypothetical protein BDL97_19G033100 [Sphagnum fallax]
MAASAITSAVMTSQSLCSLQTVAHGPSVTSSSCSTSSGSQVSASNAPFLGGLQLRRNAGASRRASSTRQELRRSRLAALHVSAKKNDTPLSSTKVDVEEKSDEPLRIFEGSPVEKFFRPESERRPEAGNTDPSSVMKFDGPAPETINSRLAMLGLTWALISEVVTGQSLIQQVTEGKGLIWFLFVSPIIIGATLIPIFSRGESPDSRKAGPFDAKAERWNGRAAMIGLVSLIATEQLFVKGPLLGFIHNSTNF